MKYLLTASLISLLGLAMGAALAADPDPAPTAPDPVTVKLWEKTPDVVPGEDTFSDPTESTITVFLPPPPVDGAPVAPTAGIVILPGGGYSALSDYEGTDVARYLIQHNIAGFVLRYRHAPRYFYPTPLLDAMRAMRLVRAKAADYNLDTRRIGIMGFSAGGHLAALVATDLKQLQPNAPDPIDRVTARPDFLILAYPVISMENGITHQWSRDKLTNNNQALWEELSCENRVLSKNDPPTFIVHSAADTAVPVENSLRFFTACQQMGVPVELHLFQTGPHGFGLGTPDHTGNDPELGAWPGLMLNWLENFRRNLPKP